MAPTYSQLTQKHRGRHSKPYDCSRSHRAFQGAPHRKGIIYKIATMSPRKPNSARRTIAKVRLVFNDRKVFAKIPGLGEHRLQSHALVLLRGHGPKDSPGINYHLVRGLYDFHVVELYGRQHRRSKFGVKRHGTS
jgi:small subunit ribosomal protein S12